MQDKFTHNHVLYILDRGFEIVDENIVTNFNYPYLLLKEAQLKKSDSAIEYHPAKGFDQKAKDNAHPSNYKVDNLISIIERIVASTEIFEGRLFKTEKNKKINIYILD